MPAPRRMTTRWCRRSSKPSPGAKVTNVTLRERNGAPALAPALSDAELEAQMEAALAADPGGDDTDVPPDDMEEDD